MTRFLTGSSSKPSCEKKMSDKKDYTGSLIKQQSIWTEMDMDIRVQRIYLLFNFYFAHTFFSLFFNSKNNLFSYIFLIQVLLPLQN